MYKWMKKLHMYAGLLSFMAFCVWGVAGIVATMSPAPGTRKPPTPEIRYVDFRVPQDLDDQQMAERMLAAVDPPFAVQAKPQRDDEGRLFVNFFTPNGRRRYILLEGENRIQVERIFAPFPAFLNAMHVQTWNHSQPATAIKLWAGYNEFSLWAMLFMTVSGLYLWIATRPGLRWTQWTLAAGTLFFVVLYLSLR
jgi:uncharacterized iron-regulated membrane protein